LSVAKSGMPTVMAYVGKVVTCRFALGGRTPDVASLHPGYARLRRETGASASTQTVDVDLVADIYPAEAAHPSPAAGSDDHEAAVAAPVAMAPMAVIATHATTHAATLAPASGSFGRDERRGGDRGDGGDSEHCLADHSSLLVLIGCVLTSVYSVARMIRRVLHRADS